MSTVHSDKLLLIGCGIFKKEIRLLAEENGWSIDTDFIDASLHDNLGALSRQLTAKLDEHRKEKTAVFYGSCHPNMDKIVEKANTTRTHGQSCMQMLLGEKRYNEELENGAYFLLEEWVQSWDATIKQTFGENESVIRDIFQGDRKYILAVSTPTSNDFEKEAQRISEQVGLPLRWESVSLERLKNTIEELLRHKKAV